jgi:hypothetical protein
MIRITLCIIIFFIPLLLGRLYAQEAERPFIWVSPDESPAILKKIGIPDLLILILYQ